MSAGRAAGRAQAVDPVGSAPLAGFQLLEGPSVRTAVQLTRPRPAVINGFAQSLPLPTDLSASTSSTDRQVCVVFVAWAHTWATGAGRPMDTTNQETPREQGAGAWILAEWGTRRRSLSPSRVTWEAAGQGPPPSDLPFQKPREGGGVVRGSVQGLCGVPAAGWGRCMEEGPQTLVV